MDIGAIAILQLDGVPRVVRCEPIAVGEGTHFRAADNTAALSDAMRETLVNLDIPREQDGLYPCSEDVKQAAQFPPLALPADLISFSAAGRLLYPDAATKTAWARVSALVSGNQLRVYRIGLSPAARYVSQAEVLLLRDAAVAA